MIKILLSILIIIALLANIVMAWEWVEGKAHTIMRSAISYQIERGKFICKKAKYYGECQAEWEY